MYRCKVTALAALFLLASGCALEAADDVAEQPTTIEEQALSPSASDNDALPGNEESGFAGSPGVSINDRLTEKSEESGEESFLIITGSKPQPDPWRSANLIDPNKPQPDPWAPAGKSDASK